MTRVWVSMGYFDDRGDGAILELDLVHGAVSQKLRFDPPKPLCVPGKGFTGMAYDAGDLIVAGSNALHRFDEHFKHTGTLALASFNDIHDICLHKGRLYVVNTGMDGVDVLSTSGRFIGTYNFEPGWISALKQNGEQLSRQEHARQMQPGWNFTEHGCIHEDIAQDYYTSNALPFHKRKVRDYVHPNHVVITPDRVLVTSLLQKCVYDVSTWEVFVQGEAPMHDGSIWGDQMWLTRIDGILESYDLETGHLTQRVDISQRSGMYGWCRGLLLTDAHIWVGVTAIQDETRFGWRRVPFNETKTGVIVLDRRTLEHVQSFDLTEARQNKIYTIMEAPHD
jgi:hypothetical protein